MKKKALGRILRNEEIATDIFSVWIETEMARDAKPGQFVGVFPKNQSTLLPRPISICEVNEDKTALRLVYRTVGSGTRELAGLKSETDIYLLGVLGNGYDVTKALGKHSVLMAGGIGIPPMVELAKAIKASGCTLADKTTGLSIVLGYRDSDTFLVEELKKYGEVYIASEDGSVGTKGNVLDVMKKHELNPDIIFSCGPMPMLRAIKRYAEEAEIEAYISLEERMACGVGACLGCVCKTTKEDHHSHVNNTRICTDGPVFEAREVDI